VTRARNRFHAAKQQIKKRTMSCGKLKVRALICAITLSTCMNSSARRNGVPVAARNWSKQESSSWLRASRITIALWGYSGAAMTIIQQIDCNPQFELRELSAPCGETYFFSSRDTFRCAELRCTMPFCAARIRAGSASAMAAVARLRSPAAIASSPCG